MKKASGLLNPFLKSTMIGIFIPTHPSIFIFLSEALKVSP